MREQVIHCPTDAKMRRAGYYGTTWVIQQSRNYPNLVNVCFSICSPEDQFSRKKGVAVAKSGIGNGFMAHKRELLDLGKGLSDKHLIPTVEQIYQAVIRL